MKTIVITGASGLVATQLIQEYLLSGDYSLFLISTRPEKLKPLYSKYEFVRCFSLDDFVNNMKEDMTIDVVLHTAFARSGRGADYVSSLDFLDALLGFVRSHCVKSFINVSSQSVYGDASLPLWTESNPLGPTYMYAMAKYASEVMVRCALRGTGVNWTNIRLSSVCENARFLKVFVQNVVEGKPITVEGGSQICSFIDVRDVASGLYAIILKSDIQYDETYNLGNGLQYTIAEIAEICKRVGKERYNMDSTICTVESDLKQNVGMNASKFMKEFGWTYKYDMEGMVVSLFEMLK